jgi:hypothetical protein
MKSNGRTPDSAALLKRFVRLVLARQDFLAVRTLAEMLIAKPVVSEHLIFRPLMAGIVVTYARSFMSNVGIGRLDQPFRSFTDSTMANTHEKLLRCRDGLYAHRDASKSFTIHPSSAPDLYTPRIRIDTDDNLKFGVCANAPELNPENLPDVVRLCSLQSDRVEKEIGKLWPVLTEGKKYRRGTYTVGVNFP